MHHGELLSIVMIHTVEAHWVQSSSLSQQWIKSLFSSHDDSTIPAKLETHHSTSAQGNCKTCLKSAGLYESFVVLIDYI